MHDLNNYIRNCMILIEFKEKSKVNVQSNFSKPASTGTKKERWPVLRDLLCKELLGRDLKNRPIFKEGRFSEGLVLGSFTVHVCVTGFVFFKSQCIWSYP
jgi:hypothetical protein